jgi:hypothetical protein
MAEFLDRDVLEHVADRRILDVKGLHPILQSGCQFTRSATELLQKVSAKLHIWLIDAHRFDQRFVMKNTFVILQSFTGNDTPLARRRTATDLVPTRRGRDTAMAAIDFGRGLSRLARLRYRTTPRSSLPTKPTGGVDGGQFIRQSGVSAYISG